MTILGPTLTGSFGTFIQNILLTNTPGEMIKSVANIYYNYNRYPNIAYFSTALLLGGAGATLFVAEPNINAYFQPIVLQAFPFLGNATSAVVNATSTFSNATLGHTTFGHVLSEGIVAFFGFWVGGAVGDNGAKFVVKEFTQRNQGYQNPSYAFTDSDIERIIKNNPHIYSPQSNINSSDLQTTQPNVADVQELKGLLMRVRDAIGQNRDIDPIEKARHKNALLSALRLSNLQPLLDLVTSKLATKEIWKKVVVQSAAYMGKVPASISDKLNANSAKVKKRSVPKKSNDTLLTMSIEDSIESDEVPMKVVNPSKDTGSSLSMTDNAPVFTPLKRAVKTRSLQKTYDPKKDTAKKGGKVLTEEKKNQLLYELEKSYHAHDRDIQEEIENLPQAFMRLAL